MCTAKGHVPVVLLQHFYYFFSNLFFMLSSGGSSSACNNVSQVKNICIEYCMASHGVC